MSVPKKRRRDNVRNFYEFFKHQPGSVQFVPPEALLATMRAYVNGRDSFESLLTYARRYKQAVREMTDEDVREAVGLLQAKEVLES